MGTLDSMVTAGLSMMHGLRGDGDFEYRASIAVSWASLPNADYHKTDHRLEQDPYSDASEDSAETATLKVSLASPILAIDYQIRIGADDANIWTITGGPSGSAHRVYSMTRVKKSRFSPDRGRLRQ